MHKPLTSWKNVLSNLGRRVNWQNFYRSMQSRTPARRHQNSNAQLSFDCLEDRTMLTTVPGLVVTTTVDVVDATDGVVSLISPLVMVALLDNSANVPSTASNIA